MIRIGKFLEAPSGPVRCDACSSWQTPNALWLCGNCGKNCLLGSDRRACTCGKPNVLHMRSGNRETNNCCALTSEQADALHYHQQQRLADEQREQNQKQRVIQAQQRADAERRASLAAEAQQKRLKIDALNCWDAKEHKCDVTLLHLAHPACRFCPNLKRDKGAKPDANRERKERAPRNRTARQAR
jgi:hypothetical protein